MHSVVPNMLGNGWEIIACPYRTGRTGSGRPPGRGGVVTEQTCVAKSHVAFGLREMSGSPPRAAGGARSPGSKSVPNPWAPTATCDTEFYHIKSDAYPDGGIYGPEMASAFDPDNDNRRIIGYGTYVSAASGPTPGGNPENASPRLRSMHHRLSCARALRPVHSAM